MLRTDWGTGTDVTFGSVDRQVCVIALLLEINQAERGQATCPILHKWVESSDFNTGGWGHGCPLSALRVRPRGALHSCRLNGEQSIRQVGWNGGQLAAGMIVGAKLHVSGTYMYQALFGT